MNASTRLILQVVFSLLTNNNRKQAYKRPEQHVVVVEAELSCIKKDSFSISAAVADSFTNYV